GRGNSPRHVFPHRCPAKGLAGLLYVAIEHAARTRGHWSDKQYFLNTVYERFFQGYSVKLADAMGIVYTPQEIVDFLVCVGGQGAGTGVRPKARRYECSNLDARRTAELYDPVKDSPSSLF